MTTPSAPNTPTTNSGNSVLDKILNILDLTAGAVKTAASGEVKAGATIADYVLKIAQEAVATYEAHTGQPIDPTLLHPVPLITPPQS